MENMAFQIDVSYWWNSAIGVALTINEIIQSDLNSSHVNVTNGNETNCYNAAYFDKIMKKYNLC